MNSILQVQHARTLAPELGAQPGADVEISCWWPQAGMQWTVGGCHGHVVQVDWASCYVYRVHLASHIHYHLSILFAPLTSSISSLHPALTVALDFPFRRSCHLELNTTRNPLIANVWHLQRYIKRNPLPPCSKVIFSCIWLIYYL